jgi:hypothetical protein
MVPETHGFKYSDPLVYSLAVLKAPVVSTTRLSQ